MTDLAASAWPALAVLLVANLLILGHELGHYLAARALRIPVRRFAVGFGPTLLRRTDRSGTEWRLGLLPLGGYIAFTEASHGSGDTYDTRGLTARATVIAAGPAANALLAIAAFALLLAIQGRPAYLPVADKVTPGGAAERAGFQPGDRILRLDGELVAEFEDLRQGLRAGAGRTLGFEVERDGARLTLAATLDTVQDGGRTIGLLGIRSVTLGHFPMTPAEVIEGAAARAWSAVADTVMGVAGLLRRGEGAENIAGPIGVAVVASEAAATGWATLLALAGILSANIALMNLLPIPILDGGQLLFCAAEAVSGRPVPWRVQTAALRISVGLLAALLLLTTANDFGLLAPPAPPAGR